MGGSILKFVSVNMSFKTSIFLLVENAIYNVYNYLCKEWHKIAIIQMLFILFYVL